jgi:hypothetical protein
MAHLPLEDALQTLNPETLETTHLPLEDAVQSCLECCQGLLLLDGAVPL